MVKTTQVVGKALKDFAASKQGLIKIPGTGAGKGTNGQIIKNSDGLNVIKINQTPLEGQNRLNTTDLAGSCKLKPTEVATAAQFVSVLVKIERFIHHHEEQLKENLPTL